MTSNPGGVESVIMNYYRNINKEKIKFDFLCDTHEKIAYEDELIKNGSKIYRVYAKSEDLLRYRQTLNDFFKNYGMKYDAIWINLNILSNIDYLKLAKKYGIKRRIIHSHNSKNMDNYLRGILHKKNKIIIDKYATDFWACSSEAAKFFYKPKLLSKVKIIKNAINVSKFNFDNTKRERLRREYGLEGKLALGNIGRLHFQKNQEFLLHLFKKISVKRREARLILIGDGPDKEKLQKLAKRLKVEKKVKFLGVQQDIQGWLSAMDIFLFPSKFEGLGIAALEAEANGLPVISGQDNIPEELKVNPNFNFLSLENIKNEWENKVDNLSEKNRLNTNEVKENFEKSGYEISKASKHLEKLLITDEK